MLHDKYAFHGMPGVEPGSAHDVLGTSTTDMFRCIRRQFVELESENSGCRKSVTPMNELTVVLSVLIIPGAAVALRASRRSAVRGGDLVGGSAGR